MTHHKDPRTARLPEKARELPHFTPVPRQRMRRGGWSAERQVAFIEALADTGSVRAACRRLGVGEHHIYKLRRHPQAESFRKAWEAALDLGISRIEDIAMDRALNGVEEPVYHAGELVGTRKRYNDRLLMFMLRNRAPERFAADGHGGRAKGTDAIGQMERKRLKQEWRAEWEAEKARVSPADVRASIERKVQALRRQVRDERRGEWASLSEETRRTYARYAEMRARDLGCEVEIPDFLHPLDGEEPPENWPANWWDTPETQEFAGPAQAQRAADGEADAPHLPPPGWSRWPEERQEEEPNPKIRRLKDDGWS